MVSERKLVRSFGFKHGTPADIGEDAVVIDCRGLRNPHFAPQMRQLTGLHPKVQAYVMEDPLATDVIDAAIREVKNGRNVLLGCVGGRHRSVTMAEMVAQRLTAEGVPAITFHREI